MGSTDALAAAARGELPEWARMSPLRREHIARVAEMMGGWAAELGLPEEDRARWVAAAWLHDALRDAEPAELLPFVPPELADLAPPLLHGPAAAGRLACDDEPVLRAIRYHTIGHPSLDRLGRALYLADFLEPGRDFEQEWRAGLARRMPHDLDGVLVDVVSARIRYLLEGRKPIRRETAEFWSSLVAR